MQEQNTLTSFKSKKTPSLRIMAVGYYGAGNIGDDLLLSILHNWCAEENCQLTAVSIDPAATKNLLGIEAIDFYDLPALIQTMQNTDLLVLGGGGLFQGHHQFSINALYNYLPGDIAAYARSFFMARQLGVKTLAWAQGVGPLDSMQSRQIVREVFTLADWVSVRDEGSAELLREIGVTRPVKVAPDPVWAWPLNDKKNKSAISAATHHTQKKLAIVIRPWSFVDGWEDYLVTAIKAVVPSTFTLVWVPFQSHQIDGRSTSDIAFVESLMARLTDTHQCALYGNLTIPETVEVLGDCDAIFAMRLHAQILALAMGKPTLCYEYDPKMTAASAWAEVPDDLRVPVSGTVEQLRIALKALIQEPTGSTTHGARTLAAKAEEHHQLLQHAITETLRDTRPRKQWEASDFDWISAWRDGQIANLSQVVVKHDKEIGILAHTIAEREGQITSLTEVIVRCEGQIASLNQALGGRDEQIASLTEMIVRRDGQIASLNQTVVERDGQIASLNQTVVERDGQIASLNQTVVERDGQIASLNQTVVERDGQIKSLLSTRSWRVTRPLRLINRLAQSMASQERRYALLKAIYWRLPEQFRHKLNRQRHAYVARRLHHNFTMNQGGDHSSVFHAIEQSEWLVRANQAERIAIIPCGFEFDELVNQRPINAAKYFAAQGYLVLFVAWQWSPNDTLSKGCGEVWPNVYQVPLFDFVSKAEMLCQPRELSLFLVTMPAPTLVDLIPSLRQRGLAIVYDIMDEWEAFFHVGQAPWFKKPIEDSLVLQSDYVCAVSPSLRDKFTALRLDISVIGNGYTPDVIGVEHKGVAGTQRSDERVIGYFGHLTDAWFDWRQVFHLAKIRTDLTFEIIGYGEPDWVRQESAALPNLRLLGKVLPDDLHRYTSRWSAGIIPFVEGVLAEAVDPIKIYEYLYFGLPVIVTGIRHLKDYPMTYFAERKDVLDALEHALQSKRKPEELDAFLERTTWRARFDTLVSELNKNHNMQRLYAN
ncbi:polysaccharide pyruvyl transferase family protein [Pseudomonas aeruginosa]|nr:polysaccharide pyruvyl transferase family protein [Pseudomonas aeruginosa]HDQ4472654.1 polysaccharide pyruvyl transferase family protein [Pseudomonas aeruginosa]